LDEVLDLSSDRILNEMNELNSKAFGKYVPLPYVWDPFRIAFL
jgi:hypothetical protein